MGKWRYKKKSKIYTYRKRDNVDIANQSSNSITEKRKNNLSLIHISEPTRH
mgnify:CR=1 FL=1